ncbi:MAG: zinc metalloprotease HtpX [Vicinamibacterales bacterium]
MSSGLKTAALLAGLSALFMVIGGALGGQTGMVFAFVFALLMNAGSYWFSDKIVLRMYRATEVGPDHQLYQTTARLAQRAGLPMPKVYIIPDMSPNAFATGRDPKHAAVAATEGILRLLSQSELDGVIAHELTHVLHRDILISTVAATIAAAIMMMANMARFAAIFGGAGSRNDRDGANPLALLATALLAPFAAMLIQAAISRQREFAADRGGAEIAGSPDGLAQALRRIEVGSERTPMDANPATAHMFIMKPFSARGLAGLFSTHPPTEARIQALLGHRLGAPL